jgi:two-component system, cell cycle response regulator
MPTLQTPATLVAFLGLSPDERETIAACLRLTAGRKTRYELTHVLDDARCLIADAQHPPTVQLVLITERLAQAVWVGAAPPQGAVAQVPRPIDPGRLLRELDRLVLGHERAEASVIERAQVRRPAPAPAAPPAPRPLPTALLVDASENVLSQLAAQLHPFGFTFDRALTSQHAHDRMSERQYDFVFIYVDLGGDSETDGLTLCQQIKRAQDKLVIASAVVLVSARAGHADRVRGRLAGCDAYLAKPIDPEELNRLMQDHDLAPRKRKVRPA